MNKDKIKKILNYCGSTVTPAQHRPGWLIASCPFAHWKHDNGVDNNPSFGVDLSDKKHRYHCFSRHEGGALAELPNVLQIMNGGTKKLTWQKQADHIEGLELAKAMDELQDSKDKVENHYLTAEEVEAKKLKKKTVQPWPEWWLDTFMPAREHPDARAYLQSRDVPEELWDVFDLRYDTSRQRVCFPIRDWDGRLAGLHGRAVIPGGSPPYHVYKYKGEHNQIVWPGEHTVNTEQPVLLVESVFDWISVYRVYKNSMCSLSCGLSRDKVERINRFDRVVTLYDNGKGGDVARKALTKYLKGVIPRHLNPPEDLSDPGEMSVVQLIATLKKKGLPGI